MTNKVDVVSALNKVHAQMQRYFELTLEACDDKEATINPEWDAGYQSALKIMQGEIRMIERLGDEHLSRL